MSALNGLFVRLLEIHRHCKNDKFKFFKELQGSYYTTLELFRIYT